MEITGKVVKSLPKKEGVSAAGKAWVKRFLILGTGEDTKYPKEVCIEFFGDKGEELKGLTKGQTITVLFDLSSNPNKDGSAYFTAASGYKIITDPETVVGQAKAQPQRQTTPAYSSVQPDFSPSDDENDLPF